MKFSERWLREWVDPPLDTAALCEQLTMAGLEVEGVAPAAPPFEGVVVGRVLQVETHPQAQRLRVCRVDAGTPEPLTIVCGAANVREGLRAPTARAGARLAGGIRIEAAERRGVLSEGMLCSAAELGLAETAEGLLELPADAPVGADLREYLQLDDQVIELSLTPNRSDCLSVAGVAREVGVLNRCPVRGVAVEAVAPHGEACVPVSVAAPEVCPRYLGRVVRGVAAGAATPLWMQERLRRSGLRSIHPVVDVTNYVMLELGQPMHAFDLERLAGGIEVRMARSGERLTLLDGQEVELEPDVLVIADASGPLALAGIMGGAGSAVGSETRNVFLESAFFSPAAIAGRARRYGLHTDSSHRFERGVDPELAWRAMERATALLLEIAGGQAGPVVEAAAPEALPQRRAVRLRAARIVALLGESIPEGEVEDILRRLGCEVAGEGAGIWRVTPPSSRFDLGIEVDFIEEVARVHGYERLAPQRPRGALVPAAVGEGRARVRRACRLLADRGYREAITYSFVDPALQRLFDSQDRPIALANPLSSDTAVMRTSLWPGLVQALRHNLKRQQRRVRLFEYGKKYLIEDYEIKEFFVLSAAVTGSRWPEQWGLPAQEADFYDLKGDVEALLACARVEGLHFAPEPVHPALHPGQCACLLDEAGRCQGWLGALHPRLLQALELEQNVLVFELSSPIIEHGRSPVFRELSKFPAVRRDLAVVVSESVPAQAVMEVVKAACGAQLQKLQLFDVYRGKGVDPDKKSLALGLTFQDFSRTLTDEEVEALVKQVLVQLQDRLGATLRE